MRKIVLSFLFLCMMTSVSAQIEKATELFNQASQQLSKGNFTEAVSLLKKSIEIEPLGYALLCLGDLYATGKGVPVNYEEACYYYKLLADVPASKIKSSEEKIMVSYACRIYSSLCLSIGLISQETVGFLEKAHTLTGDAYSEYLLGLFYIDPDNVRTLKLSNTREKGISYLKMSAEKDCISALSKLSTIYLEMGDEDASFNCDLKGAQQSLFDISKSKDMFSPLTNPNLSTNPKVVEDWNRCLYNIGYYYFSEGDVENALIHLKKVNVPNAKYISMRASCYAANGEKELAKKDIETALALAPDDGLINNSIAVIYAAIWDDKVIAEKYFKRAIELGFELAKENYNKYILGE